MNHSSSDMMKGAAILTLAAIFTKILSALYRVPFQNIVGDTGFYIFQQVYPFYGILLALCTYAFPVMISKMIAERRERSSPGEVQRVIHISFLYLTLVGLVFFTLLRAGAGLIAGWMGDPLLSGLIAFMSYPFLLMPLLSVSKGWFQANYYMVPPAFSQTAEQLVRVLFILGLSIILMAMEASLYTIGKAAVLGSLAGAATGVFVLLFFLRKQGVSWSSFKWIGFQKSDRSIIRQLTVTGTAIGMGSMMLVLYQLMDALNVYSLLVQSGIGEQAAKGLKGIYDRGQPMLQMGVVVATSLSLAIVPIIASAYESKRTEEVKEQARLSVKVGLLFGAAAAAGLINIIQPLNTMLFQDAEGSRVLALYMVSVLLASVILTISAILQGMGDVHVAAWSIVLSLVIKYGLNQLLIPSFGTLGASAATVLSLVFVMTVVIRQIRRRVGPLLYPVFYKRLIAGLAGMSAGIQLILLLPLDWTGSRSMASLACLITVSAGVWLFFKIVWRKGLFTAAEVRQIPLGSKLERVFGPLP
ncbi:polysaccharide biosynthesis protein [Jeotgalibacillus sp. ET6]|uniref:putative polysaccharide biosynthesis protein n=1 Tax=Jeotgalibacillus sp. ET6 TaxID=3037260 RepID=UPI00241898F9|nr:polysaccharide biosynthesis protein [Jeotgalibacillus sp. ET6]MDG5473822.1 polysaccharide biosynthesis protein [Jeotgalibacillus sp. ET6]